MFGELTASQLKPDGAFHLQHLRTPIVKLLSAVREHARCFGGKRALDKLARDVNDCCAKL